MGKRDRGIEQIDARDGVAVGLAQTLALVPGRVALGRHDPAGLFMGLDRTTAARFSFLLSVPAVVLSGLFELAGILSGAEKQDVSTAKLAIATVLAFVTGYAAIAWLLRYLTHRTRRSCSWSTGWPGARSCWCCVSARARSTRASLRAMQLAWKLGVVALVALAFTVLPGGGDALNVAAWRCWASCSWRRSRSWATGSTGSTTSTSTRWSRTCGWRCTARSRWRVLTIVGTSRLFDVGGAGIVGWFALLALCSYGIYWVWTQYRSYG